MIQRPRRIHIIGSVGSGKTTLGRQLAEQLGYPHCELDNVVWERSLPKNRKRTEDERSAMLTDWTAKETWVIEGVHYEWLAPSFDRSDCILFLDLPYHLRTWRITKRFIRQKFRVEAANYIPDRNMFFKMFKWNRDFENVHKSHILSLFKNYEDKVIVIKNRRTLKKLRRDLF